MLNAKLRPSFLAAIAGAVALAGCGGGESSGGGTAGAKGASGGAEVIDHAKTGALAEMTIGDPDAPVTVIEYASVTCPHCGTFHHEVLPEIKEKYIDAGKVQFVFREFPTAPAELSVVGSMIARCAADRGGSDAYFLVLSSLYKTQRKWISADARDELMKVAAQAGLDEKAFDACVRRQELIDLINTNVKNARDKYEVNSTPSFIIDGGVRHFSNAEDMSKAIDEALAKVEG